jgi:hypothetical protein
MMREKRRKRKKKRKMMIMKGRLGEERKQIE